MEDSSSKRKTAVVVPGCFGYASRLIWTYRRVHTALTEYDLADKIEQAIKYVLIKCVLWASVHVGAFYISERNDVLIGEVEKI